MKFDEMKNTRLSIEEKEAGVSDFLEAANAALGKDAWLLVESPRKFLFERYAGQLDERLAREFASAVIFGPDVEARMEKTTGADRGFLRIIRRDPANGALYAERAGSAILRDKPGRLSYAEYFREDESGFLVRKCWRLCGVEGK